MAKKKSTQKRSPTRTRRPGRSKKPITPTTEYAARPEGYRMYLVFGGANSIADIVKSHEGVDGAIREVCFKTQEELDAYMMGVADMDGWTDYEQFDDEEAARDHVIEYLPEVPQGYAKCECQNCGKVWREKDLINPIPDLHERVDPGEVMPNGECPECHAVCHEMKEDTDGNQS